MVMPEVWTPVTVFVLPQPGPPAFGIDVAASLYQGMTGGVSPALEALLVVARLASLAG